MKLALGLLAFLAVVVISVPAEERKGPAIAAADVHEHVVIAAPGDRNRTASIVSLSDMHKHAAIIAREEDDEDEIDEEEEEGEGEEEDYTQEEDEEYYDDYYNGEEDDDDEEEDKYPMPAYISNLKLYVGETPGNNDHGPSWWDFDVDVHPSVNTTHCKAFRLSEKTYHFSATKRAAPVQWQFCDDRRVAFSVDGDRHLSVWWDSDRPGWGLVRSVHTLDLATRPGEVWSNNETERNKFETYEGPDFRMTHAIWPGDGPKQGWKFPF